NAEHREIDYSGGTQAGGRYRQCPNQASNTSAFNGRVHNFRRVSVDGVELAPDRPGDADRFAGLDRVGNSSRHATTKAAQTTSPLPRDPRQKRHEYRGEGQGYGHRKRYRRVDKHQCSQDHGDERQRRQHGDQTLRGPVAYRRQVSGSTRDDDAQGTVPDVMECSRDQAATLLIHVILAEIFGHHAFDPASQTNAQHRCGKTHHLGPRRIRDRRCSRSQRNSREQPVDDQGHRQCQNCLDHTENHQRNQQETTTPAPYFGHAQPLLRFCLYGGCHERTSRAAAQSGCVRSKVGITGTPLSTLRASTVASGEEVMTPEATATRKPAACSSCTPARAPSASEAANTTWSTVC